VWLWEKGLVVEFCANQWKVGHVVKKTTWSRRREAKLYLVSVCLHDWSCEGVWLLRWLPRWKWGGKSEYLLALALQYYRGHCCVWSQWRIRLPVVVGSLGSCDWYGATLISCQFGGCMYALGHMCRALVNVRYLFQELLVLHRSETDRHFVEKF
jgi:hypothetical protein